jgi:hypothetical protein
MRDIIAFNPLVRLPTGELDENRAIDIVGGGLAKLPHEIWSDKEFNRELLQTELEEGLREGTYDLAVLAVKEAGAGNEIAHAALVAIARGRLAGALPERKPGYPLIEVYGQRAMGQPFKRPRGRNRYDNFPRNMCICLLVLQIRDELGLHPMRNRTERRADRAGADRTPSAISVLVKALARYRGLHLNEASVQENLWKGLPGVLARRHYMGRIR